MAAFSSSASFTRPSNTNTYAANDIVGATAAALEFKNMGRDAGSTVMITSASLEIDRTGVISGETSYTLHLYNVTPPSAAADEATWDLPSGDRASYLGYISLGTPVDVGSTLYVETNLINKQIRLAGTSLFGYLVTVGGYVAASATVHKITLHTVA
jgi:hypothetical protein